MRWTSIFPFWLICFISASAQEAPDKLINENAIALTQAFLNLPDEYIGGVAMEDRHKFLSLVSHYGDIDFANGYFKLGGDGARAYDTPVSRFFQMKILPRENTGPICMIAPYVGSSKPISIISFGPYWRWEDVTEAYLPPEPEFDENWYFDFSRNSSLVVAAVTKDSSTGQSFPFRKGGVKGRLNWEKDHFTFTECDYPDFFLSAIRELPPKYLADVPLDQRDTLIEFLQANRRLYDEYNSWLHFPNDVGNISATAPFWIKPLKRVDGDPYLFIHMAKPISPGGSPGENQTYILKREGNDWSDQTERLIKQDLSLHYRPIRDNSVQVGTWKEILSQESNRPSTWDYGRREFDLEWNHSHFVKRPARREVFTSYGR